MTNVKQNINLVHTNCKGKTCYQTTFVHL